MQVEQDEFENSVFTALSRWNMPISRDQVVRLRAHFDAMVEVNRAMNLTRITKPAEAAIKHYVDSLSVLSWADHRRVELGSVLDIGTGAGFPAVPLAIMRPQWSVTAIDATAKKVRFVRRTAEALGLTNLHIEHAHSAHWHPGRAFDLTVSRASGRLPRYLEQAVRLVAPSGWIIAYKTADLGSNETDLDVGRIERLQLSCEPRHRYDLELDGETLRRALHIYRKHG